ncbi:MAG: protein kinase domain-containing protein [Acidimicrobiales bacterium]
MAHPNIPGFHIDSVLGRGGFAAVYLGIDDEGNRAAIKVLADHAMTEGDLKRFDRERLSMTALSGHPNIVDVLSSGETPEGSRYLVLEYVDGGSVRDRLDESGAMHWAEVLSVGVQICNALDAAHRSGVLHRDLKPANILLHGSDAKLGDFGIARLVGQTQLTAAQSLIGTLAYTPPELFHNRAFDGRGDIYQLGITMYEMLLGRAPFTSAAADNKAMVIRRILENPAPPLAQFDVPLPISDLLDEVLAKDPNDRPQTASEFGVRLNEAELVLGRPPTSPDVPAAAVADTSTAASTTAPETVSHLRTPPFDAPMDAAVDETAAPVPPIVISGPGAETVIEPADRLHADRFSVGAAGTPTPPVLPLGDPIDQPSGQNPASVTKASPTTRRPPPARRWPKVAGAVVALGLVGGAGFAGWQISQPDAQDPGTVTTDPPNTTTVAPTSTNTDAPATTTSAPSVIVRVDQPQVAATDGSDGVMFAAVVNSQGMTAVGAAGNGERVSQQQSVVWTMSNAGQWNLRDDFAVADGLDNRAQRLWDIGVLDGLQLFAVGEASADSTDGIGWIGLTAAAMRPVIDSSFVGPGAQSLRGVVADPSNNEFIVVGQRRGESTSVVGLWTVSEGDDNWSTPEWTPIAVGAGGRGVLTDVALGDGVAIAVGHERIDGDDRGVIMIRRDDVWVPLLEPIGNSKLEGVAIGPDRVIAVGTRVADGRSSPIAVVTDFAGTGFVHTLPVGDASGRAHGVAVLDDGSIVAVGDVGEVEGDAVFADRLTDGALWQLLPGDELADDRWATRETTLLRVDGYEEFWSLIEHDGTAYALGRAGAAGEDLAPAAVWTLDRSVFAQS